MTKAKSFCFIRDKKNKHYINEYKFDTKVM